MFFRNSLFKGALRDILDFQSLSYAEQYDAAQNLKKVFVREIRKIGTFSALYLDSHVFFQKKKL